MKKYYIVLFTIVFLSIISIGSAEAKCNLQNLKGCNRQEIISLIKDLVNSRKSLGNVSDPKLLFSATEIIANKLPETIEFWTEAYCPKDGSPYDYTVPGNYWLLSCEKGETGSHGGCPTCIMSKITLANTDVAFGPYQKILSLDLIDNGYAFSYKKDDVFYFNHNGKIYGPYDEIDQQDLSSYGFGFVYRDDNYWYVNVNGERYGAYDKVGEIKLSRNGFGFDFTVNETRHSNINGEAYSLPSDKCYPIVSASFLEGYLCADPGNYYITIRNRMNKADVISNTYGPYDSADVPVIEENSFGFSYVKDGKRYYNINNVIYGPYDNDASGFYSPNSDHVYSPTISGNEFGFIYRLNGGWFYNVNNRVYGPYEEAAPPVISSQGFGLNYKKDGSYYASINGKIYGPYSGGIRNIAVLGKVYRFSYYDNGYKTNINGKIYDGYGYSLTLASDKAGFLFSDRNYFIIDKVK